MIPWTPIIPKSLLPDATYLTYSIDDGFHLLRYDGGHWETLYGKPVMRVSVTHVCAVHPPGDTP